MQLDVILKGAQICANVAAAIAALWALRVYRSNSRRERARWAETLYARFFEKSDLKDIREIVDSNADDPKVEELVSNETAAWTDYLNFFEFVAYLQESKQLSKEDVGALLGYYLECLKRHRSCRDYIQDKGKGFEHLRALLFQK